MVVDVVVNELVVDVVVVDVVIVVIDVDVVVVVVIVEVPVVVVEDDLSSEVTLLFDSHIVIEMAPKRPKYVFTIDLLWCA